ncbi:hypothetical protein LCM20_16785 [Halobacillus litoralis]|uniref:hypothetical protein n=1 Tax=Halobacillus litoralis TaxID=45668 RepID=UPI001CD7F9AF|nr:hypothetical protein [Halobacillus litoralis]MCA0972267.1 hypothetical protein [Halobacillus litoralis]
MNIDTYKTVFSDYELEINESISLHFSFLDGHRLEMEGDPMLSEAELMKLNDYIKEYKERRHHRDQLVREVLDYAIALETLHEVRSLFEKIEQMEGVSLDAFCLSLAERVPQFVKPQLEKLKVEVWDEMLVAYND